MQWQSIWTDGDGRRESQCLASVLPKHSAPTYVHSRNTHNTRSHSHHTYSHILTLTRHTQHSQHTPTTHPLSFSQHSLTFSQHTHSHSQNTHSHSHNKLTLSHNTHILATNSLSLTTLILTHLLSDSQDLWVDLNVLRHTDSLSVSRYTVASIFANVLSC